MGQSENNNEDITMIKFGTGGFRGVIGDDFNRENVQKIAQGLCDIINSDGGLKTVVVGYDHRFGSDFFAAWIGEVLAANGVKCLLYTEPMPSPAVMTAVRDERLDYGFMITASHNPYYFNGVKLFVRGGADAGVEVTDRLERALNSSNPKHIPQELARKNELIVDYSNKTEYLNNIKSFLTKDFDGSKVKVLYDNLNGVGARCVEPMFDLAGVVNRTVLNTDHDAFFSFAPPNPTENAMQPLRQKVIDGGYDFAMATDSDSDRLGILDERGEYVSSNLILACLYYYLVKYRGMKGDAVKNCATTTLMDKLANKLGYACHETDVGFKNISSKMRETDALIGGESSGGLTVRGYISGKDSVFSSMLFTEMVSVMNKPISEIVKEVEEFAGYDLYCIEEELRFDGYEVVLPSGKPNFFAEPINVAEYGGNVKYLFSSDEWALARKSGTEPVVRVFAECRTKEKALQAVEAIRQFILDGMNKTKENG